MLINSSLLAWHSSGASSRPVGPAGRAGRRADRTIGVANVLAPSPHGDHAGPLRRCRGADAHHRAGSTRARGSRRSPSQAERACRARGAQPWRRSERDRPEVEAPESGPHLGRDGLRLYVDITRPRVMALVVFTGLPGARSWARTAGPRPRPGLLGPAGHGDGWRREQRVQRLPRARDRRLHGPHPQPAAARPRRVLPGRGARLRRLPHRGLHRGALRGGRLAARRGEPGHHRVLRLRLHDVAQAAHAAEHRHRRRGGGAPRRSSRPPPSTAPSALGAWVLFADHLPVDPAALLGHRPRSARRSTPRPACR